MLELLVLFKWTILASMISASVLAFIGVQLAATEKSVQVLSMSQGAILGVLIGMAAIGFAVHDGSELETHFLPLLFSSILAFIVSQYGEYITRRVSSSKNTYYVAIFSFLMAFSYLLSSMFPALESHMTQVFFGDLATLTNFDSIVTVVLSAACFVFFFFTNNVVLNDSFESAIYGLEKRFLPGKNRLLQLIVNIVSTVFICFSIQFLGLLFTISCLFIPTSILAYHNAGSVKLHVALCMIGSVVSSALGILLSLYFSSLSTVPCIVVVLVAVSFVMAFSLKGSRRERA